MVFFGGIVWILLQLHDEAVLLNLDPFNQRARECVVDKTGSFALSMLRVQDDLADVIVDVMGGDPRDRTNVGFSCIPEQKRSRDIVSCSAGPSSGAGSAPYDGRRRQTSDRSGDG